MKNLTLSEKREFYSALLSLYGAGFSYTDAFSSIETSTRNKNIKILAKCFRVEVQNGVPFDKIAIKYKEMLGVPYALLLSAGDKSGKLDEILATILSDLKRLTGLRNGLIASLTYPVLMFFAALGVLLFCRFCFFKIFDVMYTAGMSPEAMMSLAVTAILKILLIYAVIFGAVVWFFKNQAAQRAVIDFFSEKTLMSAIFNNYFFGNFFSVLGASYEAGIPVTEAIFVAAPLLKAKRMAVGLSRTRMLLCQGESVTKSFAAAGIFDDFALSKIATGEKAGKLGESFYSIVDNCERRLQESINVISNLVKPVSILIVGLLVGYIAVNFYSHLYGGLLRAF